jgi:hypothetical protein
MRRIRVRFRAHPLAETIEANEDQQTLIFAA